jgi:hypothetical protein
MVISNCSIILPLLLCIWNFQKMCSPRYLPFLVFVVTFGINEIVSLGILLFFPGYKLLNSNLYMLFESLILFWMFKTWNLTKGNSRVYHLIPFLYVIIWGLENYYRNLPDFLPYFIISYAFFTVMMSIAVMNKALLNELTSIVYNPVFTICCTCIVFFIYVIIHAVFWLPELNTDIEFKWRVFTIFNIINILCNVIYVIAILQIRKRQKFHLI